MFILQSNDRKHKEAYKGTISVNLSSVPSVADSNRNSGWGMDRMGYRGGNSSRSGGSRNQTGGNMSYRSGYDRPYMSTMYREDEPMLDMYFGDNARMGYSRRGSQPRNSMGQFKSGYSEGDDRYGRAYNEYKNSKCNYTETKSPADKEEMDRHADEHMMDTIATIREIYKTADPELRIRMKSDLNKLISEMPN